MWLHESKYVFGYDLFCWKLKTIKKNNFLTIYYCLAMFIGLNSLFMANEQCITRWFKKKKSPKCKRGRESKLTLRLQECNITHWYNIKRTKRPLCVSSRSLSLYFIICISLRVCLVLEMEKWEKKKKGKGWKSGRVEEILLSPLLYLVESGKVNGWKKN